MAGIEFLGQPLADDQQIGRRLATALTSGTYDRFRVLTAWAKVSGLSRLRPSLAAFTAAGGSSEIVVGVDAQGGTWEGLELAAQLFSSAWIFHDRGSRTFHPKVYLLTGPGGGLAIVGSSNLTKGGLFSNYEASVALLLDPGVDTDVAFRTQIDDYIDWFLAAVPACRQLDDALITELRADPGALIVSERMSNRRSASRRDRTAATPSPFGTAITGLSGAPAVEDGLVNDDADDDAIATDLNQPSGEAVPPGTAAPAPAPPAPPAAPAAAAPVAPAPPPPAPPVGGGFYKRLSAFDVSTTSAPGQIIIPIRFLDFFPPMVLEQDDPATGKRRHGVEFPVVFRDGAYTANADARAILYEPAITHPRQNTEIRFTHRSQEILARLQAGNILEFTRDRGQVVVTHRPAAARPGRFNWI